MPLGTDSDTVKFAFVVPALPSVTVTSSIAIDGTGSLSVIVPVPIAVVIVALPGFDSVTRYVSLISSLRSPWTVMGIVCVVAPGANVRVPVAPV